MIELIICLSGMFDLKALQDSLAARGSPWTAESTSVAERYSEDSTWLDMKVPGDDSIGVNNEIPGKIVKAPPSWDWRNYQGKDWMTPVKDQMSCANCWCFAIIGAFETRIKIVDDIPDSTLTFPSNL